MKTIDEMSVNALRILAADMVQKANSGHPGLPLGAAHAYELWANHMNFNPADLNWRTATVLSFPAATAPPCSTPCCTCSAAGLQRI